MSTCKCKRVYKLLNSYEIIRPFHLKIVLVPIMRKQEILIMQLIEQNKAFKIPLSGPLFSSRLIAADWVSEIGQLVSTSWKPRAKMRMSLFQYIPTDRCTNFSRVLHHKTRSNRLQIGSQVTGSSFRLWLSVTMAAPSWLREASLSPRQRILCECCVRGSFSPKREIWIKKLL